MGRGTMEALAGFRPEWTFWLDKLVKNIYYGYNRVVNKGGIYLITKTFSLLETIQNRKEDIL